jgi:hypothetical protein
LQPDGGHDEEELNENRSKWQDAADEHGACLTHVPRLEWDLTRDLVCAHRRIFKRLREDGRDWNGWDAEVMTGLEWVGCGGDEEWVGCVGDGRLHSADEAMQNTWDKMGAPWLDVMGVWGEDLLEAEKGTQENKRDGDAEPHANERDNRSEGDGP